MKKILFLLVSVAAVVGLSQGCVLSSPKISASGSATKQANTTDQILDEAFASQTSNLQVEGQGTVTRLLADDTDGSRHQRFIIRLASGQTLLIAHNIDIAPRINSLEEGDTVMFYGEYEWNAQGGVIHWTHRDPDGRHVAGWLKHDGRIYQ